MKKNIEYKAEKDISALKVKISNFVSLPLYNAVCINSAFNYTMGGYTEAAVKYTLLKRL